MGMTAPGIEDGPRAKSMVVDGAIASTLVIAFTLAVVFALASACTPGVRHERSPASPGPGAGRVPADEPGGREAPRIPGASRSAPRTLTVVPLSGWPRWAGEVNHQISGLAFRDGHLFAISDQ